MGCKICTLSTNLDGSLVCGSYWSGWDDENLLDHQQRSSRIVLLARLEQIDLSPDSSILGLQT
jgi:hypothetical protein